MNEATSSARPLSDNPLKAPPTFPNSLGSANRAHVEFYKEFKREADEYDEDFIKKYDDETTTTLIFAGLFSAVTSAFILDVQKKLEPDFQEMSYHLLKIVASVSLGNVPTGADAALPQWNGPDPIIVNVQAILYSSLAASVFAAFIAMLGKQWLNRYAQVEMRGSIIDRSRHRQRKMNGMVTWNFDLVMECFPLMLQAALLLLGYALSQYLFFLNKAVAGVVIGFVTFGFLFYFLVVSAATLSYNCPFQTPLSLVLRFLIRFDDEHKQCVKRFRKWVRRLFYWVRNWQKSKSGSSDGGLGAFNGNSTAGHIELSIAVASISDQPPRFFKTETDWYGYVLDSNCIAWMFEMTMDMDVIMAIMRFIPEVVWHAGIRTTPLERLYDTLYECFDRSSGHPAVIPKLKDRAYLSAKAFLHLVIQRKCICDESDKITFKPISSRRVIMAPKHEGDSDLKTDSDLESTLCVIYRIFGGSDPIHWQNFSFTVPHHIWMSHILVYYTWDVLRKVKPLPDDIEADIKGFILYSAQSDHPPPAPIVADCFFLIGFLVGIGLHRDDLSTVDKSSKVNARIDAIYEKLEQIFRKSTPGDDIDRALEALKLISHLLKHVPPQKSYNLFHVIVQSIPGTHSQKNQKWEASCLALHGAYKEKFIPRLGDPRDILIFLKYHFELVTPHSKDQDTPIQNALCALAYTTDSVDIEAIKNFDSVNPSFIRGICYAFQGDRPPTLREAALLFLSFIGDRWFTASSRIISPTEMSQFYIDWASIVDGLGERPTVQAAALIVLLGMANSPHWCSYIVPEKWTLLKHFALVPDGLLCGYINNLNLMDKIRNVDHPMAMVFWVEVLWAKYAELTSEVQGQLAKVTKEIVHNEREEDPSRSQSYIDKYLANVTAELRRAENAAKQDPAAVTLRENLQRTLRKLEQCCSG